MKGEKAEYRISLEKAFLFPATKRVRKALNVVRAFVTKHTRAKDIMISNEVNEAIHKNSKNIPRYINAVLYKDAEKVAVFLKKGNGLDAYLKKKDEEKKKKEKETKKAKEEKKAEKKETAVEKKEAADAEKENKKRLLEEKRAKEEAGKAIEIKRG